MRPLRRPGRGEGRRHREGRLRRHCRRQVSLCLPWDQSGTHTKEISLWPEDLGITADAASVEDYTDWYTYSNAGMGVCLTMAEETGAYILSDKATFLTFQANNGAME